MIDTPADRLRRTAEGQRLAHAAPWRRWGPYLSERQWGTVREDYSADGDAWAYLPHDHARSRAYRWGEDGLGGWADDHAELCMAVALWNGCDPILKERLFGLTNAEGNHGEDVKEQYFYLDGLPSHAYMRMLYKYPQGAFPYADLIAQNAARGLSDPEYELIDTGIFDQLRYFDVEIEYAKASPEDTLLLITVHNRGPETATVHVLPHLWARNTWRIDGKKPVLAATGAASVRAADGLNWCVDGTPELLFCDNETNTPRLYGVPAAGYFKDGIGNAVVRGDAAACNPARRGTKMAAHYVVPVAPGGHAQIRVRLGPATHLDAREFDAVLAEKRAEADEFYAVLQAGIADPDRRLVQRQALAGMLWSKQFYYFEVRDWLRGDPGEPAPPPARATGRNADWEHLVAADILSMPDTWEYPWFAAWDLAFHCVTFALIDPDFAKNQLLLLTRARLMHPNGKLPAYEWSFDDANPPVHAWAALRLYDLDRNRCGVGDIEFLTRIFNKLILNFTWWVNRRDATGRNIFQGGFLGLDNIGLFNRSAPLPDGRTLDQSDGTAWMAAYALHLMRMACELSMAQHVYEEMATKFFEHFLFIAQAVHAMGGSTGTGLWDDVDGFYYDVLEIRDQPSTPLRVRSMVGLIPMLAVEVLHEDFLRALPAFEGRMQWFLRRRPDLAALVSRFTNKNRQEYRLLALMRRDRLCRVLSRMLDPAEFLSDYGVRAVSKYHEQHPCVFHTETQDLVVRYTPAESDSRLFGGNSNWRGPIWMPLNFMIIEALHTHDGFYDEQCVVEYPTGSGRVLTLGKVAEALADRLTALFLRGADGRRPALGEHALLQDDPHFRDCLPFHEYFHGDTGKGLGASHQTGWTGLIALLLHPRADQTSKEAPP